MRLRGKSPGHSAGCGAIEKPPSSEAAQPAKTPCDAAAVRALVERIAASRVFQKSARLRDFLAYITGQTLNGELDRINETLIALHVFDRKPGYDSSSDNVVRVQARLLRQKLKEYFSGEGNQEPLVIEIPKGGYVPVFIPRQPASLDNGTAQEASRTLGRHRIWVTFGTLSLIAALLASSIWFWWQYRRLRHSPGTLAAPPFTLGSLVVRPGQKTLIIVPDAVLLTAEALTGKEFPLAAYASRTYQDELFSDRNLSQPRRFFGYLISKHFTDIFAVALYGRFVREYPQAFEDLEVRHPRSVQLRDFRGKNVILIGSPRSNPWAKAFQESLAFRFISDPAGTGETITDSHLQRQDARPAPGLVQAGPDRAFGLVALFPNPYPPGRVLLIAGSIAPATEALGDLATSPAAIPGIEKALGGASLRKVRSLELILAIEIVGDAPKSWSIVSHRASYY